MAPIQTTSLLNRLVQPVGFVVSILVLTQVRLERGCSPVLAAMWVYMWGAAIADFIGPQG